MKSYYPESSRYTSMQGGVIVHSLFSFDNFFDPQNIRFGQILAFNDYQVAPGCGFGYHPHQELEQVFLIYKGQQEHSDSLGSHQLLKELTLQRITAGSGYARKTSNSGDDSMRYLGVWFQPRFANLAPGTETRVLDVLQLRKGLLPVISGHTDRFIRARDTAPMALNSDATVFLTQLSAGQQLLPEYSIGENLCLLYVIFGKIDLGDQQVEAGAHLRIHGPECLRISALEETLLIVIELD